MKSIALSRLIRPALITLLSVSLTACGDKGSDKEPAKGSSAASGAKADGTEAGAKELLSGFLKPGADVKTMSAALRPTKGDYEAVFSKDFAAKLAAAHDPEWEKGTFVLKVPPEKTELSLAGYSTSDIRAWTKSVSDNLPGGYKKIKDEFNEGFTVYKFEIKEPGKESGIAFDALIFVNGQWRLFPKPFRAAR
jgi:hypothetical protein